MDSSVFSSLCVLCDSVVRLFFFLLRLGHVLFERAHLVRDEEERVGQGEVVLVFLVVIVILAKLVQPGQDLFRGHARSSLITCDGSTPVRRWSRPWYLTVKRSWSKPSICSTVAWKSWMCTGSL